MNTYSKILLFKKILNTIKIQIYTIKLTKICQINFNLHQFNKCNSYKMHTKYNERE